MRSTHVFVKLDFANAFNAVRRDVVREAVVKSAPGLLGYFDSAYGAPSHLSFGDFTVSSADGVQQGDPLGPMLFSLVINPLLLDIQSKFISGHLDDIVIGGLWGQLLRTSVDLRSKPKPAVSCSTTENVRSLASTLPTGRSGARQASSLWNAPRRMPFY